ncbi:hypothetical protein NBRC116188_09170 [Oceaniserpentilla sp. 4NH20-0058]|uniref:hypothetical protein n=1 Tax=Oceaniserpentilla sp. 4NH20-0058 TaxID=3127660 RepID=UPI0031073F0C
MRMCFIFLLMCVSLHIKAQHYQDIIYKTDGSVLKGTLLERNFSQGKYKIELASGEVLYVPRQEIEFIDRQTSAQPYQPKKTQQALAQPTYKTPDHTDEAIYGTLFVGSITHTLTTISGTTKNKASYTGVNLAGQYHLSPHFAFYADVNLASYSELKISNGFGDSLTQSGSDLPDEDYSSTQLSLILSSNLQTGWQLFTGIGGFSENYETSEASFNASGAVVQLGMGYNWHSLQIIARLNVLFSPDYTEAVDRSTTGHIQLGFNL